MVEEAQEQVEEVRRKEVRDAKFQYASVTFDTFKPAGKSATPPPYQPQDEEQQHEHRLASFARNFNPTSNRAMLARSYEIVTPVASSGATGAGTTTKSGTKSPTTELEEYDKLVHQERKMTATSQRKLTGASQRKFSISTRVHGLTTNYSQLEITSLANGETAETAELGVKKIKPMIKKRTKTDTAPSKIPSYSLVQKPKAPPLPPRYDPDSHDEAAKEEVEEEHYKVPRPVVHRRGMADAYNRPSSLARAAWSCDNIRSQDRTLQMDPRVTTSNDFELYDTPSSYLHGRAVHSQRSLVREEPLYANNVAEVLQNSVSVGSYIDMTGSQVSYI